MGYTETGRDFSRQADVLVSSCAILTILSQARFLRDLEITRIKKSIFSQWLTALNDQSTGCDFEYHDERSKGIAPGIDLYVSIVPMD